MSKKEKLSLSQQRELLNLQAQGRTGTQGIRHP